MAFIYTNAINASHYFLAQRYPATMRIKAMGLELAMGMILQQSMAQRGGRHFGWQLLHPLCTRNGTPHPKQPRGWQQASIDGSPLSCE